ncbi:MAG: hypothetical protein E7Z77_02320 [Methanobrevibacter sp.]|uniref:hypothetical protein n=1 Tax=Methanobrevibacter sp. TaxID=66852 RepID=UPI0025E43EED|nr:hypothetical protein [Methanobrevibacter sp.]MBE6508229.1 hypothetical protein [Methanobrevibacter sp.]
MIKAISELEKYHNRMTTVINELKILEDGVDANYSDIVTDYHWLVTILEQRRETLQKRGRHL